MTLRKSLLTTSILAATLGLIACGGSSNNETATQTENQAPTAITLDKAQLQENTTERVEVGTLSATDADSGDTHTFTTNDENFEIEGDKLFVKAGKSFNFEETTQVTVSVTVSDGTNTVTKDVTVTITNVNEAPTDLAVANIAPVKVDLKGTQVVADLSASDEDAQDEVTFSTSAAGFKVENNTLVLDAAQVSLTAGTPLKVTVIATDKAGAKLEKEVTVSVANDMYYDFLSKNPEKIGQSSVAYSGQIARHVLIKELSNYIKADFADDYADGADKIGLYYDISSEDYENVWGSRALTLSAFENSVQKSLVEISNSHKDLKGKLAGNDAKGQYKDWTQADSFVGWAGLDAANNTPTGFAEHLIAMLRDNAKLVQNGSAQTANAAKVDIDKAYITPDGVDLQQLIEKFLNGAVAFSQAADDYLDDDTDGKGLKQNNTEFAGKTYTSVEHQWDEGFGYFGAARNYTDYTDIELSSKVDAEGSNGRKEFNGSNDTNADGKIDLLSEYNWGNSTNAGKRDRSGFTDLSKEAYDAFYAGRKLLNDKAGQALSDAEMETLVKHATAARLAWEKAIVATSIHYINDVLKDLEKLTAQDYTFKIDDFYTLAKHWSEMKGFALNMQFNPVSPFVNREAKTVTADFVKLHELMGNAPVFEDNSTKTVAQYEQDLKAARNILRDAYTWNDKQGNALSGDDLEKLITTW
ncbi:DUF4856 domain-containing protein [Pseudoalteromonas phenolica]|uniref:DUF4856 domain-containing protein n=1 Tax=Pseudoalteromonas phenolica TaxID=161398 RepID=UPI00384BD8F5